MISKFFTNCKAVYVIFEKEYNVWVHICCSKTTNCSPPDDLKRLAVFRGQNLDFWMAEEVHTRMGVIALVQGQKGDTIAILSAFTCFTRILHT